MDLEKKDFGDVSSRVALRKNLKCNSFQWYLDNIYPEKFVINKNCIGYGMVFLIALFLLNISKPLLK